MMETKRTTVPEAEALMYQYFPVLDHGFIAMVDYMGGDDAIVQAARVSYGAGTTKTSSDRGLLRYLVNHKHTTPLEMAKVKVHVAMPIFVARQWIRHRMSNTNEYSGRYSEMPQLYYTPQPEQMGVQSTSNKQGREGGLTQTQYDAWLANAERTRKVSQAGYEDALDNNIARELARIDLPLSMYTYWYWTIDLHNLMHFLRLRCDTHAQWEVRQYADKMAGMLKAVAPHSFDAWVDYVYKSASFSRHEMRLLQRFLEVRTNEEDAKYISQVPLEHDGVGSDPTAWAGTLLSKREMGALFDKLSGDYDNEPDFELDMSTIKPAKYFQDKVAAAVPSALK